MPNTKIANGLFMAEMDLLGITIESFASSIPDILRSIHE